MPNFYPSFDGQFKVYSSLEDYVNEFTLVEDVKLKEFGFIFTCYFAVLSTISIIYLLNWLLLSSWLSFRVQKLIEFSRGAFKRLKRFRLNSSLFRKKVRTKRVEFSKKPTELKVRNMQAEDLLRTQMYRYYPPREQEIIYYSK